MSAARATTMAENHWVTLKGEAVAGWEVALPPTLADDVSGLLAFARGVVAAGEAADVYRVLEMPGAPGSGYIATPDRAYADFLAEQVARTGVLPLFATTGGAAPTGQGRLRTPARLAYFDGAGQVVENDVVDLGELLENVHPRGAALFPAYAAHVAPVVVSGLRKIDVRAPGSEPVHVSIAIYSDIWLPRVVGFLEVRDQPPQVEDMFDNRALAERHTPRLNAFVGAVRALVAEVNGTWQPLDRAETLAAYRGMWDTQGIDL